MRRLGAFFLAIMGCLVLLAFSPTDGMLETCGDGFSPNAAAAPEPNATAGLPKPSADGLAPNAAVDRCSPDAAHVVGQAPESLIPPEAIRIRILAHSDRAEDQEIKGRVRDRVMALIGSWQPSPKTSAEMRKLLAANLEEIERAAEAELAQQGASYGARAMFGRVPFPAKTFAGREYPAGEYEALLIILGDGEGENWWCVLFPPLCLAGAIAKDDETGSKEEARDAGQATQAAREAKTAAKGRASGQTDKTGAADHAAKPAPTRLANGKADPSEGPEQGPAQRVDDTGEDSAKPAKPRMKFLLWELIQRLVNFLKNLFGR